MARSYVVGMPSGLVRPGLPLLGIRARLSGLALYPLLVRDLAAASLASGVSHTAMSTPGVLRPRLVVTVLTARSLASNECVSARCGLRVSSRRPSVSAAEILVWSLLAWRSTLSHGMVSRLSYGFAGVPSVALASSVLESLPFTGPASFPSARTCGKSAAFRRVANVEPLSGALRAGVRFLPHPLPAAPSLSLAGSVPNCRVGGATGLPSSAERTVFLAALGSASAPGESTSITPPRR